MFTVTSNPSNVFTSVCQPFCPRGVCLPIMPRGKETPTEGSHPPQKAGSTQEGRPPRYSQLAGGMRPTEMHTCLYFGSSF